MHIVIMARQWLCIAELYTNRVMFDMPIVPSCDQLDNSMMKAANVDMGCMMRRYPSQ